MEMNVFFIVAPVEGEAVTMKRIKISNTFWTPVRIKVQLLGIFGRDSLFRMSLFIAAGRYTSRQGLIIDVDGLQNKTKMDFLFLFLFGCL